MYRKRLNLLFLVALLIPTSSATAEGVRVASFNLALNRRSAGALNRELATGKSQTAQRLAEIIQRVDPDILLINEIDFDETKQSVELFCTRYLETSQRGQPAVKFIDRYVMPVNTGVPSGFDLNKDGKKDGPADSFGYGAFPGQYGMAVLSKFPIKVDESRTFQRFLWKDMPDALQPRDPNGLPYYPAEVFEQFRLSSKSHWDVAIDVQGKVVHFLVSHPTPPVFDGPEDRNGTRNHDEIRFWADYVSPDQSGYIYDDHGKRGGLEKDALFLIAGDLNADPNDGDSTNNAIRQLVDHPRIWKVSPKSKGAVEQSNIDGQMNTRHKGDAAMDTGNFPDERTGNLRIDYVLPSKNLKVLDSGVFWPTKEEPGGDLVEASDHRLVWVDVAL